MGRKKGAETSEETKEETKEVEEDSPIVKTLKELDDQYLAIQREYEKAAWKLQLEFKKKQQPFLDQRKEILTKSEDSNAPATGTPAVPGFWKTTLSNSNSCEDIVQEWDLPVLEYLTDVTCAHLNDDDEHAGFKLSFQFAENPYFTNDVLWKEFHTAEVSPYAGEIETKEIKCCEVKWKPGKDVTIEKIAKKVKGGGAKKAKQKNKEQEEPRESFFRDFFQSLKEGMPLDELHVPPEMMEEDCEEDEMLEYLMGHHHEIGCDLRDSVIPYAVRWYTGECKDDEDDDDEGDEEEDDDDDDEDDSDEDDSDDEPKGRGRGKKAVPKKSPKSAPNADPASGQKAEECKQQ